jgi:hypothetical protein
MTYPEWAALSREQQAATVSIQNLGHALTHIRRAISERNPPELTRAWTAIDASRKHGGVSEPDRYIVHVHAFGRRVGKFRGADYSEVLERCEWAIALASEFASSKPAAKLGATKPATPSRIDQEAMTSARRSPRSTPPQRRPIGEGTDRSRFRPCNELVRILAPAYRCRHFDGVCEGLARWKPEIGHVPRGFTGAFGTLDEIELVLIVGEPGKPWPGERYESGGSAADYTDEIAEFSFHALKTSDPFNTNFRRVLDECFPDLRGNLYGQMRRTWKAESYLCSTPHELGDVPRRSSLTCGHDYLRQQLALLADRAAIVACGYKARNRLRALRFTNFLYVGALSPPGCNTQSAREGHRKIPAYLAECNARRGRLPSRGQ